MNEGKKEAYVYCGGDIEEGLSEEEGVKHDEHGLPISRSLEEVNEPNFWEGCGRVEEVDEPKSYVEDVDEPGIVQIVLRKVPGNDRGFIWDYLLFVTCGSYFYDNCFVRSRSL